MKLEDATKILESIQQELQRIEDPNINRGVSVLLNLIEMLAADNARLKQENQLHKDEVSFLNSITPHMKMILPPLEKRDQGGFFRWIVS